MEFKKLDFGQTIKDAFVIGVKNIPSIVAAYVLFFLTIWIPYINVGTYIAITLLPTELAKGEVINPLYIFRPEYRKYMGEFFITIGLMIFPVLLAFLFMIIPGFVLTIAWSLALYMLICKNKNPMQAIKASNDATYGSKWAIFGVWVVLVLILGGVLGCILACTKLITDSEVVYWIVYGLVMLIASAITMGATASIWKQLKDNVE